MKVTLHSLVSSTSDDSDTAASFIFSLTRVALCVCSVLIGRIPNMKSTQEETRNVHTFAHSSHHTQYSESLLYDVKKRHCGGTSFCDESLGHMCSTGKENSGKQREERVCRSEFAVNKGNSGVEL
uniref:Uncharacterized protein n=1 Tax=Percolomonas cosmopolitus TaxID=63605 RepID=A0A7S1KSW9_9EUKA|mmetsp:Transcript_820/g.2816  ORF Transcript_820/g.2816 Transcript_820/m.2816 type:complete len:125 (+) Transcript_820:225-599(+)